MQDLEPHPRLRPLDIKRIVYQGAEYFLMRDPLELAGPDARLVPVALGPLLSLLNGSRGVLELRGALRLRHGINLSEAELRRILDDLSAACLLDDARSARVLNSAMSAYHGLPHRPLTHAGRVYPGDARALRQQLRRFSIGLEQQAVDGGVVGMICPHIDYARGGPVYARLWQAAATAAREAEVAVIFGTDHMGGPGRVTLTRQDYATPWGRLPTDVAARDAVADAVGPDAFAEELHHRGEHSVELAAVWLHHARGGEPLPVVPVLCGHPLEAMEAGRITPDSAFGKAVAALRTALSGRRVLAIAAADLAHVGPAFGDPAPFGEREREVVRTADEQLLSACAEGSAGVLRTVGQIADRFRICGLAPLACLLEFTGPARVQPLGYDQCAADDDGGSWVSISGALLYPLAG